MDALWVEFRDLRDRQDGDFDFIMNALSIQRDDVKGLRVNVQQLESSVHQLEAGVEKLAERQEELGKGFSAYRGSTGKVFDTIEVLIRHSQGETADRFDRMDQRISSLEKRIPPAS